MLRRAAPFALVLLVAGCLDGQPGTTSPPATSSPTATDADVDREMYIIASDLGANPDGLYALRPATFAAERKETLNVTLKGAVGNQNMHTLVLAEFDFKIGPVSSGAAQNQTLVVDQAGTFQYFCDVGNHRALGMEGTLTVSG